jgi:hypothetical protein
VPSLLGGTFHAPFFHDGSAPTLDDVFAAHQLPGGGTIDAVVGNQAQRDNLRLFLGSIDGRTETFVSEVDQFRDALTP